MFLAQPSPVGNERILEGEKGFLKATSAEPALEALTDGLGERYRICEVSVNPYPSCKHSHAQVDAAPEIAAEGVYESWEAHTREIVLPTHIVTPDGRRSGLYEARYRRYRLLAAQLEPLMTDPRAERTCSKLGGEV